MKILLYIIFLFIPCIVSAQTIHGNVSDAESGIPLDMATVVLERKATPIDYVLTDAKGNYTLQHENLQKGDVLSVTYMGYQKMSQSINGKSMINFKLKPQAFTMKEVEIKGGRIYGRQDTTKYDLKRFVTDRDNSLKDVLKKLPGIDVDKSGAISYNGKEISKFTVEGLDITNGSYNVLNENIRAKDVDKAEIIDHYQPIRSLAKKVHSDKVALNIKLLPQAKNRWIYSIKAEAGIADMKNPVIWDGTLNAMQIGKKRQGIYNIQSDNCGKDIEKYNTRFYSNESNMLLSNNGMPSWLYQPSLNAPLEEGRMRLNHSYSANFNNIRNKKDNTQIRINGGYVHNENEQQTSNSTTYLLNDGKDITTSQSQDYTLRSDKINTCVSTEKNTEDFYLKNETNLNGRLEKSISHFINDEDYIYQSIRTPRVNFDNNLRIVRNIGNKVINFQSLASFEYSPSELMLDMYNEKFNTHRFYTDNAFSCLHKNGFFTSEYSIGVSAEDMYMKEHNWSSSIYSRPRLEYKGGKLNISANALVQWKRLCRQQKSMLLLSPQLYAELNKGFRSTYKIFTCYLQNAGGWSSITPSEYRQDYRTWISNDGTIPRYDYFTASAGYEYKQAIKELFWSVNGSYSKNKSNTIGNTTIKDGNYYITNISSHNNSTKQWTAKALVSKGWFSINTKASCQLQYDFIKGISMTNSELSAYRVRQLSFEPKLIYSPSWCEIEYSGSFKYSKTTQDDNDDNRNLLNWVQNLSFTKTIRNIDVMFNMSHYRNDLHTGEKSYFTLADASVVWRLYKVRLCASVKNIFNKKEYSYTMNQGNIISTSRFILRPRTCTLSVQCDL